MTTEPKGGIMCHTCTKVECMEAYPEGMPKYCLANRFQDVLEQTKTDYMAPEVAKIYLTSGKVVNQGYRKWTRIQEAIEFAKELGVSKVGFASCVACNNELRDIGELFRGAGLEVFAAACQIGRVPPEERGVPEEYSKYLGLNCNPITQAEILNREGTELNFILGLCLGHDILFTKFSKAPVSTLIVKDRILGDNPSAALNNYFYRRYLWKKYCGKAVI